MDQNEIIDIVNSKDKSSINDSNGNVQFKITKQIKQSSQKDKNSQQEKNNNNEKENINIKLDEILYPFKNDIDLRNRPSYQDVKQQQNQSKNKSLGNYILNKTVGEGTFGKVKIATHKLTGEKVAIKILEKSKIGEVADVERVSREIHILKLLRHPSIVQLYEIIETSKQLFLVMEFAQNGELFEYIVKQKRVKEQEACRFFQQILNGVQYMHQLKIVHRDLKPENLLLTEKNQIKIIDFGLSNTYKRGEQLLTACGSPCYAAPEMIAGKRYNGLEVDIWSCGVILHALVCGYLPFEDPNTSILYQKILACEYQLPNFISNEVKDLITRILNSNPQERFTISQIREHPWFKQNFGENQPSQGIIIGQNCIPIDREILKQCQELGCDQEYTQSSLEANKHNHVTTVYYLLLKKHILNGGQSNADINSLDFDKSQLILPKRKVVRSAYSYHAHNSLKQQQQQGIKIYNTTENEKLQELIDKIKSKNSVVKTKINEQVQQQIIKKNSQENQNYAENQNQNQKLLKLRNYKQNEYINQNQNLMDQNNSKQQQQQQQQQQSNLPQIKPKNTQYRGRSQEVNYKPEVNYQSKQQSLQMYNSQSPSPPKKAYVKNSNYTKLDSIQTQQQNQAQNNQIQQNFSNSKQRLGNMGVINTYRQTQQQQQQQKIQKNYYTQTNNNIHQTTTNSPANKENKIKIQHSKNKVYSEYSSRRPSFKQIQYINSEKKKALLDKQQLNNIQQDDITYKNYSDIKVKDQQQQDEPIKRKINYNTNKIISNINTNLAKQQQYLNDNEQNKNFKQNNNVNLRIRAANLSLDNTGRQYVQNQQNQNSLINGQKLQSNQRDRIKSLNTVSQQQQSYQQKLWINGLNSQQQQ